MEGRKSCYPKWTVVDGEPLTDCLYIKEAEGCMTPVAEVTLPVGGQPTNGVKRQLLNAYLIAKAPEMFEIAIDLSNMVSSLQIGGIIDKSLYTNYEKHKNFIRTMVEEIGDLRNTGKCVIDDTTYNIYDIVRSNEEIAYERNTMYFIMSHTDMNTNEFMWPCLPDPAMGEEFVNNVKKGHAGIAQWIKENPEKFELAKKGYYK